MLIKSLVKKILNRLPIKLKCMIQSARSSGKVKVGAGSYIHPSAHILGEDNIQIGMNSCISEGGWFNVNQRDNKKIAIEIGNNCFIGKHNFFSSGDLISIGDYTLTTIGCKFIGSTHKVCNPENPYLLSGTTNEDQIIIGANCFIGAGATVLGNVKVGHGSVIGAESLVLSDVPPFSIAIGNPAVVVKRYSFIKKAWLLHSDFSLDDDNGMPNEQQYLEQLRTKFPRVNMPWIASGKSMGNL